jgi:cytochrome c553
VPVNSTVGVFFTAPDFQLQETSGSKAPINQRHDIRYDDQQYSGAALTCADCHNPHADQTASRVHDPDSVTPVPLNTYTINNSYTKDGYNFDYNSGGNLDPINPEGSAGGLSEPDYIQFCLTCHDGPGNQPPGVVMDSNMEDIADAWAGADVHGRGENAGTGTSTNKGGMKIPWIVPGADATNQDPSAPYAALNCTTCHGAHGSGNIHNLRTSITVGGVQMEIGGVDNMPVPARISDPKVYTLPFFDGKNINEQTGIQQDHYWGAWCSFCHKMDAHPGKVEADSCTGGHMHNGGAF